MNAISIKNLRKVYANGVEALKGINLEIEEGDFFALLGPNGAGKTTIIGIICGLVNKSGGEVRVFGKDIDKEFSVAKSYIGIVPQELNFSIFEKVQDIVVNQGGFYGIAKSKAERDSEPILKQLDLWGKRNDKAQTLSGGMKRRLMIARALIHHPKLLILDEPTAGVDIELRRGMWVYLQKLSAEGKTIILTTHYLEEAEQLCRNVAIINKGEIIEEGRMGDLLGKLSVETFVFYIKEPPAFDAMRRLGEYDARQTEPGTIEASLKIGQTMNELMEKFNQSGIKVVSMRNKANRLEEVFVRLTAK